MAQPLAILTNVGSLSAQNNLAGTSAMMSKSIARLSSGLRVQSAADDAAGMAVSENMRAQLRGFQQALRNANDGVSVLQTGESGYQSVSDMLVRMRELAVQAATDALSDSERGFLNTEFQDLVQEIDRVSNTVEYNGIHLLDGTAGDGAGNMTFQVGTRNSANDRITILLGDVDSTALAVNSASVDTLTNSQSAIDSIDGALDTLANYRSDLGAAINHLTQASTHLGRTVENYGAAVGQIRDTDVASESANFARAQVLQQAGVSVLAQANSIPALALRLLG
ncbi:MAG: flagellin FliC [Deltaproteobacteria bacterium]|nr:flagellin FliC [Deltaproteobacteria bacterium]MCB9787804.1 flagellin FliC [Deltaproteobacteria bacterium]